MIKTQHTPGPWTWENSKESFGQKIKGRDGKAIAAISGTVKRGMEECQANAALIAAAPDLLNAAKLDNLSPATNLEQQAELESFARELGWKEDMPVEHFAREYRTAAIRKATQEGE